MNNQDILGSALADYLRSGGGHSLFVHTSYDRRELYDTEYFFRTYEEMPEIEHYALSSCRGRVLDIGAGAGSHSIYLQDQGFDVTALDISPGCINVMLTRGVKKIMHINIFNLPDGGYNTLLLLMNGIGITGNLTGMVRFLEMAEKITASGAEIIFDSTDISYAIIENPEKNKYFGELKYRFEYKGITCPWFDWLYIDSDKLFRVCRKSAWIPQVIYVNDRNQYLARLRKKY